MTAEAVPPVAARSVDGPRWLDPVAARRVLDGPGPRGRAHRVTPSGGGWPPGGGAGSGRGCTSAQTGDLDWLGRAHAAVLRGGDGCAVSLRSAEYLHGVTATAPAVITVAVPSGRSVTRLAGTRYRRHVGLDVVRRKGLPVTSAEQTVLDLADVPGVQWREAVATAARWVQKRRTTAASLATALEGRARHRHRRILSVALGVVADGAESLMEVSYVRQRGAGARAPASGPAGTGRHPAARLRVRAVARRAGGRRSPRARGEFVAKDRTRDRRAAGTGRVTLRAGWVDVEGAPCELAVDVHAALRARGYRGAIRVCGPACAARRVRAA